jgi:hypothetical protein
MQNQWAALLNPILANPLNGVQVMSEINLKSGVNVLNHGLGRNPQGWFLVDKTATGDVYRTAPFNNLTLTLTASAAMTVSIGVF